MVTIQASTRMAAYDKARKLFIAEASTLGLRAGDDVPDHIRLTSHVTADVRLFVYKERLTKDGEVVAWVYECQQQGKTVFSLHVVND